MANIVTAALRAIGSAIEVLVKCTVRLFTTIVHAILTFLLWIWKRYCSFCDSHNFRPVSLLVSTAATIVIIAAFFIISAMSAELRLKNSVYGLKDVGELVTQSYYYRQIRTIRDSRRLWGWDIPLTERECIFSYDGVIRAGYNFEEIEVKVENKRVTVKLPEPYIITNEILTETFSVYDEDSNIFNPLHLEDIGGEIEDIRTQGEYEAIQSGLFEATRENAMNVIEGFLSGFFDFDEYELVFAD